MIATDFKDQAIKDAELKDGYQIKIFGRLKKHVFDRNNEINRPPELCGLAPCNRID
jgi:hypothetical protein